MTNSCLTYVMYSTVQQTWVHIVCICSVTAELPVLSTSGCCVGVEVVVGPGSGSDPAVRTLLEQLAELWVGDWCSSAPLHLLFTPLTVTAVLKASDTEVLTQLSLMLSSTSVCDYISFTKDVVFIPCCGHLTLHNCVANYRHFSLRV